MNVVNTINGWIILDKPSGITSAHAVAKIKRLLKPAKIGHAGTLDPLASGVLPLALGEATKTVAFMMDARKAYGFTVRWGEERDTDDIQGQVVRTSELRPTREQIEAVLPRYTGAIQQMPPDYSAIKVDGQRAYDAARRGQALELKAREVVVHSLALTSPSPFRGGGRGGGSLLESTEQADCPLPNPPPYRERGSTEETSFICHCGKGTYIRSLARDIGRELGCFGTISVLRRLQVGKFDETTAISLEVLENMVHKNDLGFLQPVESALDDILALELDSHQAMLLRRGQTITLPMNINAEEGTPVLAKADGQLVAICVVSNGAVKPVRGFNI